MLKTAVLIFSYFSFFIISNSADAAIITLQCEGTYKATVEKLKLKIDEDDGLVKEWSTDHMAFHLSGNYVSGLCENTGDGEDGYGYESILNIRASSNGATILEMSTTADSYKIAVSSNFSKASFKYSDLGAGNGNHEFELTCKKI